MPRVSNFPIKTLAKLFAMNTARKRPLKQQRNGDCNDDDDDDNNNGDMDAYDLKQVLIKNDLDFLRHVDDDHHHHQHGISDLRHESLSHILKHNIEIGKGHGVKSLEQQLDTADDDNNNSATMLDDVGMNKDVHQYSQLLNAAGDVMTDHVDDCPDDAKVSVGALFRFCLIVELFEGAGI